MNQITSYLFNSRCIPLDMCHWGPNRTAKVSLKLCLLSQNSLEFWQLIQRNNIYRSWESILAERYYNSEIKIKQLEWDIESHIQTKRSLVFLIVTLDPTSTNINSILNNRMYQ